MENLKIKNKDDGLDFHCEACGDREGGCQQCGFGREAKEELQRPVTQEELDEAFKEMEDFLNDSK